MYFMSSLQIILSVVVLLLAIPVGYLIAWLARDELVQGRKWFKLLIGAGVIISIIGMILFLAGNLAGKNDINRVFITAAMTGAFIVIVSAVSLIKSWDKKWVNRKV